MFGVQLFFVVSAFSLCLAYSEKISYRFSYFSKFIIRRIFRIAPMYCVGIFLYWCLRYQYDQNQPSLDILFSHAILLHGLYPSAFGLVVPGGWSIGCEFIFYLLFPALIYFLHSKPTIFALITLILLVNANMLILLISGSRLDFAGFSFHSLNIIAQLPVFAIGILSHRIWRSGYRFKKTALWVTFALSIATLAFLKFSWDHANLLAPTLCGLGFSALLLIFIEVDFRLIWLEKIGLISFSLYIIHFVFTEFFARYHQNFSFPGKWFLELPCFFAFTVAASAFLSVATYRFIELPLVGLGRRIATWV